MREQDCKPEADDIPLFLFSRTLILVAICVQETAEVLSLTDSNVKVRLHRAHELLRADLSVRAGANCTQAFVFQATSCDRVVHAVFERLDLGKTGE